MTTYRDLPLAQVTPSSNNVRHGLNPNADEDDALLLDSIRAGTILQPILVRPLSGQAGQFEIIAGERRYLAAKAAGLDTIPAIIDEECSDLEARRRRFIENAARKNLSAYQHCQALADYAAAERLVDPGVTQQQLAERLGMNPGSLGRSESVWRAITPPVHEAIVASGCADALTWAALASLAKAKEPELQQKVLARICRGLQAPAAATPARSPAKRGSGRSKLPQAYRRVLDVDMGDDPTAPRNPQVRLRPTRSPGKPEIRLTVGCAPLDLDPLRVPVLIATLRTQADAAIRALEVNLTKTTESGQDGE